MKSFIAAFIIATCTIALVISTTQVQQCPNSVGPLPISVTLNDCTSLPCDVANQGIVSTIVEFTAVSNAQSLNSTIEFTGNGFSSGSLEIGDICDTLTSGSCPLQKGEKVTGFFNGTLIQTPSTVTTLSNQVIVFDENQVVQFCFDVTFHIDN